MWLFTLSKYNSFSLFLTYNNKYIYILSRQDSLDSLMCVEILSLSFHPLFMWKSSPCLFPVYLINLVWLEEDIQQKIDLTRSSQEKAYKAQQQQLLKKKKKKYNWNFSLTFSEKSAKQINQNCGDNE